MRLWGNIIGISVAITLFIWFGCFAVAVGFESEALGHPLLSPIFWVIVLFFVTGIVASVYLARDISASDQKPRKGSGTFSEMIERAIELLEAGTLPSALPQVLLDEFSGIPPAKGHEIARIAIKRWQAQG